MNIRPGTGVPVQMKRLIGLCIFSLVLSEGNAQVVGQPTGTPATRSYSVEHLPRDSVGQNDMVIAVQVDSLCRIRRKSIVRDIPNGCANVAMQMIDDRLEVQLMKLMRFKCTASEISLVFPCESGD